MPSGVRLADPIVLGIASSTSSTSENTNHNSSSIDTVSCAKPLDLVTTKIAFNESFASSDDSAKMGCSENIETSSSCSSSPITSRDSPTDLSRKEVLSNRKQHIPSYTSTVHNNSNDRDFREGSSSPINHSNFLSSSADRISPIEGSLAGFRSYSANKDPSEYQPIHHPALPSQLCSPSQHFHYIPRLSSSFPLAPTSASKNPITISPSVIVPPPNQVFDVTQFKNQHSSKLSGRNNIDICNKSPSLQMESVNTSPSSVIQSEENSSVSATPHGIENILNRPLPRPVLVMSPMSQCHQQSCSSTQFQSSFLAGLPRNLDFNNGVHHSIGLHASTFSGIHWPTLQSFIDNPGLQTLRDRFRKSKNILAILLG